MAEIATTRTASPACSVSPVGSNVAESIGCVNNVVIRPKNCNRSRSSAEQNVAKRIAAMRTSGDGSISSAPMQPMHDTRCKGVHEAKNETAAARMSKFAKNFEDMILVTGAANRRREST